MISPDVPTKETTLNILSKRLILTIIVIYVAAGIACGPSSSTTTPKTEPTQVKPTVEPLPVEQLRKQVPKDPAMYKAVAVIKEYGKFKKKYMSFEKYKQLTKGQVGGAIDPDWFYDGYSLNMNENKHYITVTYGTAKRAIERDDRIEKVLEGLPHSSITVNLTTPRGITYLLTDAEADGVLDFASNAKSKNPKVDIKLLDTMQEKYTWIVSLIKRNYKKIKK